MQDVTPTPAGEPKQENTFRGLFSRMAIGQCVHAALCVAIGAAIGLSAGRVQSVAVRLIVEREEERMAFRSACHERVQWSSARWSGVLGQCASPEGAPLYPVAMIRWCFSMTTPICARGQVARVATTAAIWKK